MQDHTRGGWYGQMTGRGELVKDAPRGAILYARLLWTFSAAYRVLKHEEYLAAAAITREYICHHFIDPEYGGTYWSVTADGQPLDTKKQFYAISFMIYGFAEYARATGDRHVLETAVTLFEIIERHAWDHEHGGYIEACTCDWQPIDDMRLSDKDQNYPKSQNTHLHIMESYTNLLLAIHESAARDEYRELGTEQRIETALRQLIEIFAAHIINPRTRHLDLFFDNDWSRKSNIVSYGHDIECSWLLDEATEVLADTSLSERISPIVQQLAIAGQEGILPDGSMAYEGLPDTGPFDSDRHWWVQAEAIVGLVNIYRHFGDEQALHIAARIWDYIKRHLIDWQHGEWFWSIRADGTINDEDDRAGFWKCPYHNGRMCLNLEQWAINIDR